MKRILFITNIPSFYKVNQYNELQKRIDVEAVFIVNTTDERSADFIGKDMRFKYHEIGGRSLFLQIRYIASILRKNNFDKIVYTGWNYLIFYIFALFTAKRKNGVVIESNYIGSAANGARAFVKRLFLSRIATAYVSGEAQRKLAQNLGFAGDIVKTYGVGVANFVAQAPYREKATVTRFIYVGRLTEVKNLPFLVDYFNHRPDLSLTLVGMGSLEQDLKSQAKGNVHFAGAIDNKRLPSVYQSHDVFILPSKSEPWGLVVEEALNNGLPVLVSDKVGCGEEIVCEGENGYIFKHDSLCDLDVAVRKVTDIDTYNRMAKQISKTDVEALIERQISGYLCR